jgi:hypothetical protein
MKVGAWLVRLPLAQQDLIRVLQDLIRVGTISRQCESEGAQLRLELGQPGFEVAVELVGQGMHARRKTARIRRALTAHYGSIFAHPMVERARPRAHVPKSLERKGFSRSDPAHQAISLG